MGASDAMNEPSFLNLWVILEQQTTNWLNGAAISGQLNYLISGIVWRFQDILEVECHFILERLILTIFASEQFHAK